MSEETGVPSKTVTYDPDGPVDSGSHLVRNILLAAAGIFVLLSLYLTFDLRTRMEKIELGQKNALAENAQLLKRLGITEASLKASEEMTSELSSKLGMTQKDVAVRAAQLRKEQAASEERLKQEQQTELGKVNGEVAGVKTDLGGAKTDIAATRSDLEATKGKLDRALGDLNVQSGLIARTRDDLETLKHKGDRNYYEFTLKKNEKPQPVSTVSLQLKKIDSKKGKFSLNVLADDKTIEKKDRTLYEPLQFYTGRDRMLYELVVFTADKNSISGYISTPKTAPVPALQQ